MGLYSNISQNMVKLGKYISYTLSCKSCAASLFLSSFDIICDLLLKRFTAIRNLLVKFFAMLAVQVKAGGNERVATGVLIPFHTNFRKLHASWCKGKTKNLTLSCLSVKFTHHILILGIITSCIYPLPPSDKRKIKISNAKRINAKFSELKLKEMHGTQWKSSLLDLGSESLNKKIVMEPKPIEIM